MLRTSQELKKYAIHASDGNIGHVVDCYFDDQKWTIRYLIVDTGSWLTGRKVLISPFAVGIPQWDQKTLPIAITMEKVENSPDIDTDKPVSRQHEYAYMDYYDYPAYWGAGLWGGGMYPDLLMRRYADNTLPAETSNNKATPDTTSNTCKDASDHDDVHLRSCNEVIGYKVNSADDEVGHITGMLIDEKTWTICYLIVDTGHWWSGHKIIISPLWIDAIQWSEQNVVVSMTLQEIKDAPLYDMNAPLEREHEDAIHQHYKRIGYWHDKFRE